MIKLLQKQNGAVFYASQCTCNLITFLTKYLYSYSNFFQKVIYPTLSTENVRIILSPSSSLTLLANTGTLQRGLSAIAEHLAIICYSHQWRNRYGFNFYLSRIKSLAIILTACEVTTFTESRLLFFCCYCYYFIASLRENACILQSVIRQQWFTSEDARLWSRTRSRHVNRTTTLLRRYELLSVSATQTAHLSDVSFCQLSRTQPA